MPEYLTVFTANNSDVKNGFKSKAYEMSGVIDVYDPKFYDVELLIAKEHEWSGNVMRSYMEILKYCSDVAMMDGVDDADEMEIKQHRDEAVKKYYFIGLTRMKTPVMYNVCTRRDPIM